MTAQRQLRVGVQVRPQHTTVPSQREAWKRSEDAGVDTLWTWDHFFPTNGDPQGNHFECWTLLGAMAVATERVEFGAMVTAIGYRNPALLSDMAKTIDHLSGGRLILGLGGGWKVRDYEEFGYGEMPSVPDRLRELRRGIEIIKERWTIDVPPPVRNPIPILIGGGGEKVTLRITAQHAQIWNMVGRPEVFAAKNRILDEHCRAIGRDPSEIERSVNVEVEDTYDPAVLDSFAEAGGTHIILRFQDPWDFKAIENLVAWRDRRRGA
jgi:probable F420-dependent oxidoreductase